MSVSKFLIYELTVSIFCFFVLSHLRQDSPENIRGQENGMIPVPNGFNKCEKKHGSNKKVFMHRLNLSDPVRAMGG